MKITNLGIQISCGDNDSTTPKRSPDADQQKPRGHYVYAHIDGSGKIFYIGKGVKRRAWSKKRHSLWIRYVERHLKGNYSVEILDDNLTEDEAEKVETVWISYCGLDLVNWDNEARGTDFKALELFHERFIANKKLLRRARTMEKRNLKRAATMYIDVIAAIPSYRSIKYERGLVGRLMDEEAEENGQYGELDALDRLSMCLIKLGRVGEAAERADEYFNSYREDLRFSATERIKKRIAKALAKLSDT